MAEASDKALHGRRVVVTRAADQGASLVEELRKAGAVPLLLPMIAFGRPDNSELLDNAMRHLQSYDWVFVTSQNALRAMRERCEALNLDLHDAFSSVKVAAVGPATAEALEQAGLHVAYVASKHQGVALAEELADDVRGKRVLLPRSDRANPELVESLKRLGAEVTEVCAYKTIPPEQSDLQNAAGILAEGADAVLFFSPSAVHHLEASVGEANFLELSRHTVFAAIGPITEEALRKARVTRVLLPHDTSVKAILEALAGYFSHESAKLSAGAKPL